MKTQQIEIAFATSAPCRRAVRRPARAARARWWFSQMRALVDRAVDWQALPERMEQNGLPLLRSK